MQLPCWYLSANSEGLTFDPYPLKNILSNSGYTIVVGCSTLYPTVQVGLRVGNILAVVSFKIFWFNN
jgi:hypothetical protein